MYLNAYQQAALRTAATKDTPNDVFHLLLGLVGETGEIADPPLGPWQPRSRFKKEHHDSRCISVRDRER